MIDIHNHTIFGVDDGAKTVEESLEMLMMYIRDGVKAIICTPHVQSSAQRKPREVQIANFNNLKSVVKNRELPIDLYLGSEVMYREHLHPDYGLYTLNETQFILIEFTTQIETDIESVVFELKKHGMTPIIAHIERYEYLKSKAYPYLKKAGALFQVNTSAILGLEDKRRKKITHYLLKEKMVDFVATDAHRSNKKIPNLRQTYDFLVSLKYDINYLNQIFSQNQEIILK